MTPKQARFNGPDVASGISLAPVRTKRPSILISNRQLNELTKATIHALNKANDPPKLFTRSGELVRIKFDEKGRPIVERITDTILRKHMSDAANFYRAVGNNREVDAIPPLNVATNILAMEEWSFPALTSIVEIPILRPDGSIADRPGYDEETAVYYCPDRALQIPPIPKSPTGAEIKNAVKLIKETIGEFPYVDTSSYANAVALVLTPIIRQAIKGVVPIGLIDAVNQGTGKSLLSDVISLIPTGRTASMMTMAGSEDEWRKRFTSTLYNGTTVVFIDNIAGRLDSATLASVLTAWTWSDRWLGANKMIEVPNRATWIGNGNNIQLGGDMQRRAFFIRMDAKSPTPWLGRTYTHENLIEWVTENRGLLLAALMTLVRAWYAAGRPKSGMKPIGRFEEWTEIVTGVLAYSEIPGCLDNLQQMYDMTDEESGEWERFLRMIEQYFQARTFTTASLVQALIPTSLPPDALPDELSDAWNDTNKRGSFSKKLGKAFRSREARRYGPDHHRVVQAGTHGNVIQWRVLSQ